MDERARESLIPVFSGASRFEQKNGFRCIILPSILYPVTFFFIYRGVLSLSFCSNQVFFGSSMHNYMRKACRSSRA